MAQVHSDYVGEYMQDAWRRSILFLDVLRQRGNIYQEQKAKACLLYTSPSPRDS